MKNIRIPEFQEVDPLADNISRPTSKAIVECRNHPSIISIRHVNKGSHFHFSCVSTIDIFKVIKKLGIRKATQSTGIPVKILKENAEIFYRILFSDFQ